MIDTLTVALLESLFLATCRTTNQIIATSRAQARTDASTITTIATVPVKLPNLIVPELGEEGGIGDGEAEKLPVKDKMLNDMLASLELTGK